MTALNLYIISLFIIIALYFIYKNIFNSNSEKRKWLNGPIHIPIIGGGLHVAYFAYFYTMNDTVTQVCNRYGSICGFWGSPTNYFVFVNDAENARKILKDENFNGKFPQPSFDSLFYGKPNLGILHSYGGTAKELRQRTISYLRKYGWGKSSVENLLNNLAAKSLKYLEEQRIQSSDSKVLIDKYTFLEELSDHMWEFMIGSPFPGSREDFRNLVDATEISLNRRAKGYAILFAYKILRFIPGLTEYDRMYNCYRKVENIIKEVIKGKRKNGKYKEIQESLLDKFLIDVDEKVHPDVNDEQLVWILNDLQLVGTTGLHANSLQWALLYLSINPEVMKKMVIEIDSVIGRNRQPSLEDRLRMPYTEAVILETIRMGNVVNYAMRSTTNDITFDGYFIPKHTQVMVDTECLRKDPSIWSDPHIFRPERFYDEQTNNLINFDKLNAFGFKRPCLGEQISKQSNFIFLVCILQKYFIETCCSNTCEISTRAMSGIIGRPQSFYIKLISRV